jgi:hypothetical protein
MIGFISTSVTKYNQHSSIPDLHTFQFTVAHALEFSVFTSRFLATDLNTETSTSNHYEVFLPFLVQSPWNLGTQLKTLWTLLSWVWVLCYDRQAVGQSVLEQGTHLGPTTKFLLLSESCGFVDVGRFLWREDGYVVYNCCWSSPVQSF